MTRYQYSVGDAVLKDFAAASKRHRQNLLRIFYFLAQEPFTQGESTQADSVGRKCQVKRFGPWLVTYWPEHLTKEIHILDIDWLA
jgi:hypothetical protein